ncbi:hypothetical protein L3X38_031214 [Prunus dulcis]|uniref:Uncharacterized protein n=1 Tax=Prunus dulcis TaxID=3755 RepID=A0AAD4VDX3_PRUDU|nr:hypothetical protein L3X38_031214 [Prunus dulcis]
MGRIFFRLYFILQKKEREEEDFEDDATSSTKKWKRQKKDSAEQPDQGAVTVAYHGTGEQAGYDLCSDLNVEPSSCLDDVRQDVDDNVDTNHGSEQDEMHQDDPILWEEGLGLNPMRGNKLLCQENSTNEDFDVETFGREDSWALECKLTMRFSSGSFQ